MKNYFRILFIVLFLLVLITPVKSQNDIKAEIERLENKIDSLKKLLGPASSVFADYDTLTDAENLRYGVAGPVGITLDKKYYFINYNSDWKIAYWVAHHLTSEYLVKNADDKNLNFLIDRELPKNARSTNEDYRGSGRQRGHMAPDADFQRSNEARASTFIYSNACPEYPKFNNGIWKKLEGQVRNMVKEKGEAWIVTGTAFLDADSQFISPRKWIGKNDELNVAEPTHVYKVILAQDANEDFTAYTFLMPNDEQLNKNPTYDYIISVDRLEQITGYDFFPGLKDNIENEIEERIPTWQY